MNEMHRFNYLLDKLLSKTITIAEKEEFFDLLLSNRFDETLQTRIGNDYLENIEGADLPPHIAQEIVRNILLSEKKTLETIPSVKVVKHRRWIWAAAAVAACLLFLSVWLFKGVNDTGEPSFVSVIPPTTIQHTNTGKIAETIVLPDNTAVTLQPHATLHYPAQFTDTVREVYLEGNAFFKVTRKPNQLFYVYYNKVVTKVLGTSFDVSTNDKTGNIEVAVQSGKVQVYENRELVADPGKAASIIVTPNQKAIYKTFQGVFESTLVEHPQPVNLRTDPKSSFVFEQAKLSSIFTQLENAYDISIVVENESIYNCVFSGDITRQDLYGKLEFICLTINASYEINGTKILVKGKGCPAQ
ncbi:MAG: FecR family protein [Candidatus Pseudobacter hemicellulosilyticus]|uniref:FecR family protein n=1 Tax=Candidatus Pseudobacter hemicellulosilyticus TaxID=3121375 RepID=A0AAJ5WNP1_9BACT|nr:MAG: FecR family protein [Pseudobacter sp.]